MNDTKVLRAWLNDVLAAWMDGMVNVKGVKNLVFLSPENIAANSKEKDRDRKS